MRALKIHLSLGYGKRTSLFKVDTLSISAFLPLKSRDSFPEYERSELRSTSVVSSFAFKFSLQRIFSGKRKIAVRTTTRLSKSPISAIYVFYIIINHLRSIA